MCRRATELYCDCVPDDGSVRNACHEDLDALDCEDSNQEALAWCAIDHRDGLCDAANGVDSRARDNYYDCIDRHL